MLPTSWTQRLLHLVNKYNVSGPQMNFKSDLIDIVKDHFCEKGIYYKEDASARDFAARYCEIRIRRIDPTPREVHFSDELNDSLGKLIRETNAEHGEKALDAWGAVFHIRQLFVSGGHVTPYLR